MADDGGVVRGVRIWVVGFLVAALGLGGCGGEKISEADAAVQSNMRALAVAYGQFTSQNRGRVPKSEAELRKFIEARGPEFLTSLGVASVDEMFISSRDNEPYVVIYGKPSKIVAYEAVGVDGKHYVAGDVGDTREITEEELQQQMPAKKP